MFAARDIRSLPAGSPIADRAPRAAVTAVLSAMAMVVIDSAMMNVALPTIADAFDITAARSVQVVSAYQIAIVMFLLPCAALGESVGLRKVFSAGLITFAFASAMAASAPTFPVLIAARFVQGAAAAAIMALGVALLRQSLPEARLGAAIAWNAVTVAVCSAAGPMLSAAILTVASWHALFLLHLPLGAIALAISRALPPSDGTGRRLDRLSIVLSAAGFCGLFVGLWAVATANVIASAVVGGSFACFWVLERRSRVQPFPVIPLDLLGQRNFRLSIIASICCFIAQAAGLVAIPFYLQDTLGLTPLMTGVYMTPWPAAVAFAAIVAARVVNRNPNAPVALIGAFVLAAGLAGSVIAISSADLSILASATVLCGLGFGFFQVANNRILLLDVPVERSAAAGGLQGTARLTGQAAGAIIVSLLFSIVPLSDAPRLALAIGSLLAVVSAIASSRRSSTTSPYPCPC